MNQKQRKYYEEKAKILGKTLFIEDSIITISSSNLEILPSAKLVESEGQQYKARAVLKNVPVSKFTENKNNRIYGPSLDGRLIKEGLIDGNNSLADHPEDDGSIARICGVWHNPHMDENYSYGDWYLVGEIGQLIKEAVEAGSKQIGLSRVGYGSLMEDGKTVDPDDYLLERWADAVLNPSQGVYATVENIKENTKTENNILKESETNKSLNSKEIKIDEMRNDKNMDKMVESGVLRNQARAVFKEAKKSSNYKESIDDLKLLKSTVPADMDKLHEDIDAMISEVNTKFEEQLSSTGSSLKEKENLLEEITAKYQTLEASHNQLKENFKTCSAIVEKVKDNKDVKALTEMVEKLAKDRTLAEADVKQFSEEVALRDKDIACFKKERAGMLEDIKIFKVNEKKLKESLVKMVKLVKKLKEDENEDFSDVSTGNIIDKDLPEPDDDIMNIDIDLVGDDLTDIEDTIEPVESLDLDELDAEALMAEAEEAAKEDDDEGAADQNYVDKDKKDIKEEEEDEKSEKDKEEDKAEEDKEKKSESVISVNKAVLNHYKEAIKKSPSINDIKRRVLTSKNLYEATKKIEVFLDKKSRESELINLSESVGRKVGDLKTYTFKR